MQGLRVASITRPRRRYRRLSELLRRRRERSLHSQSRYRCLHSFKKRIEFTAESVEPHLACTRQRVEILYGYEHGFGSIVLRDYYSTALHRRFQDLPELTLCLTRGK